MFLSFNPAITQGCVFPRWHPDKDLFTLCGIREDGNQNYTVNFDGIQKANVFQNVSQIYDFLRDRLVDYSYVNDNGSLFAWVKDNFDADTGLTCRRSYVQFWNALLVDMMNFLMGYTSRTLNTQKLMRSVLSSEIIFWGSKRGVGANNKQRLQDFWEKYTTPVIKYCGADILFLVGGNTIETFNTITGQTLTSGDVKSGTSFAEKLGKEYKIIAAIDHPGKHGTLNYSHVIKDIKKKFPEAKENIHARIRENYRMA